MAELAGGARFPAKLLRALQPCQDDAEMVRRVGIQYALEQCLGLLENDVTGIHFYTLNRSDATRTTLMTSPRAQGWSAAKLEWR